MMLGPLCASARAAVGATCMIAGVGRLPTYGATATMCARWYCEPLLESSSASLGESSSAKMVNARDAIAHRRSASAKQRLN
eukprot:214898-Prymnesium_polylepis.1